MSLHYLAKQKNAKSHLINAALKGFLESNQKLLDFLNIADLKLQHTHTFKSPFPGLPRRAGTSMDFSEARDSEWQWHQQGHMQVCT